jgi:hypothetical protein
MAPDSDQEIHGNQHHFPEKVKQDQIHGQKNSDYTGKARHEVKMEKPNTILNLSPGTNNSGHPQYRCQGYHQKTQPIHGEPETYPQLRYPTQIYGRYPNIIMSRIQFDRVTNPQRDDDQHLRKKR